MFYCKYYYESDNGGSPIKNIKCLILTDNSE